MTIKNYFLLSTLLITLLFIGCQKNHEPNCKISNLTDGHEVVKGTNLEIVVVAEDEDNDLSMITLYIDEIEIESLLTPPFNFVVNTSSLSPITHELKVVAIDEQGSMTHDKVTISITLLIESCDSITDIDGNIYSTVKIGNQCWMAENLKVTKYPDGTSIPFISNSESWDNLPNDNTADAYCYLNDNRNNEVDTYGALYTWSAAMGDNAVSSNANPSLVQGVCPEGWHLPSDSEWSQLTDFLGGEEISGGILKATGTTLWYATNAGATNIAGFSALPGGMREGYGAFMGERRMGIWWSSTESSETKVIFRNASSSSPAIGNHYYPKGYGMSVRCVRD